MKTKTDTCAIVIPDSLAGHKLDIPDTAFKMMDGEHILKMSLVRGIDRCLGQWICTCSLFVYIEPLKITDLSCKIRIHHYLSTHEDVDRLERLTFSCSHRGCRMDFMGMDINNIDESERERLHEFLLNMRGVEFRYTKDIFGFIQKDGSDQVVITPLPFPSPGPY